MLEHAARSQWRGIPAKTVRKPHSVPFQRLIPRPRPCGRNSFRLFHVPFEEFATLLCVRLAKSVRQVIRRQSLFWFNPSSWIRGVRMHCRRVGRLGNVIVTLSSASAQIGRPASFAFPSSGDSERFLEQPRTWYKTKPTATRMC